MQHRTLDLIYVLREGLSYDFANIGHPMLFAQTYIGTKKNYRKLCGRDGECLRYLAASECITFQLKEKIPITEKNAKRLMVNLRLCFLVAQHSGYFIQVCKVLLEQDLMPRVLSGSSAENDHDSMLGVSAADKVPELLKGEHFLVMPLNLEKMTELIRGNGGIADVMYLKNS